MADILAKVKAILRGEIDKETVDNSNVYVIFYDIDKFTLRYTEEEFTQFRKEHVLERYIIHNADSVGDLLLNGLSDNLVNIYKELFKHCIEYVLGSHTVRVITNDVTELDNAINSFQYTEEVLEIINILKLELAKDKIYKGEITYDF